MGASLDLGVRADHVSGLAVFGTMQAPVKKLGLVFGEFETDFDRWKATAGLRIRW